MVLRVVAGSNTYSVALCVLGGDEQQRPQVARRQQISVMILRMAAAAAVRAPAPAYCCRLPLHPPLLLPLSLSEAFLRR